MDRDSDFSLIIEYGKDGKTLEMSLGSQIILHWFYFKENYAGVIINGQLKSF